MIFDVRHLNASYLSSTLALLRRTHVYFIHSYYAVACHEMLVGKQIFSNNA